MTTSVPHLDVKRAGDALVLKFTRTDMTDAAFITTVGNEIYQLLEASTNPRSSSTSQGSSDSRQRRWECSWHCERS